MSAAKLIIESFFQIANSCDRTKARKSSAAKPKADKATSAKGSRSLAARGAKRRIDPTEIPASDRPQKKIKQMTTSKNMKLMTVEEPKTALKPKKLQKIKPMKPGKKASHK